MNMLNIKQYPDKYTAVYRCSKDISNFKIRIRIKEVEDLNKINDENWNSKIFTWQEKIPSRISENLEEFLYTYVNEDDVSESLENGGANSLQKLMENLDLNRNEEEEKHLEYDFYSSINSSIENPLVCEDVEKMSIAGDFGEYVENTWISNEKVLCKIKYHRSNKVLEIYPDFSKNRPYLLKVVSETSRNYLYFIENASESLPEGIALKEKELYNKLITNHISLRNDQVGKSFHLPPKHQLHVHLFFEILSAKNFEYPKIYVQYTIDLPENWRCENLERLKGCSQVGYGRSNEKLVHFGFNVDILLVYEMRDSDKELPKSPYIYFEVISKDFWDVYRTEGLAYKNIPVNQPGNYTFDLNCFRFSPNNITDNLRRFFIGDCSNYNDLTWIGIPKDFENSVINKYGTTTIGTGSLKIRLNVLHQSQEFLESSGNKGSKIVFEKLYSSSLIKSVEEVIMAFKKAKKNMIEARKNCKN